MGFTWSWSNSWDNSTLEGQIAQGLIQAIIWSIVLIAIQNALESWATQFQWFHSMENNPGGTQEWLAITRAIPQHFFSALLVFYGWQTNNLTIFRHGVLAEFGYELFDFFRVWIIYFQGITPPPTPPTPLTHPSKQNKKNKAFWTLKKRQNSSRPSHSTTYPVYS